MKDRGFAVCTKTLSAPSGRTFRTLREHSREGGCRSSDKHQMLQALHREALRTLAEIALPSSIRVHLGTHRQGGTIPALPVGDEYE